jgi:hypothetical protein
MASIIAHNGKIVVNQQPADLLLEVGTFRAFSGDISELNSLPLEQRKTGMLVSTLDGDKFYVLKNQSYTYTHTDWEEVIIKKKTDELKFKDREVITGNVDGENNQFLLEFTPIFGSEHIYMNGLLQEPGINYDYICIENQIIFNEAPPQNSTLRSSYKYI